jgi:uncharacterized protein with ParB-like and HNH nuclease domain
MDKLLYSVEEIFSIDGYLKEKEKHYYNIPLYQRGYKWERKHVTKLLVDIDNFTLSGSKFYCLQNITIVPHENYFNIVDGQQRLTTLVILLSFLGEKQIVQNKVRFPDNSIRQETNLFLNEIITKTDAEFPSISWDDFVKENEHYDHQDINHIFFAHQIIEEWFDRKKQNDLNFKSDEFKDKLLKNVKLIVNKVEDKTSEERIFGNLNSKRVPLDGADLVRAILITNVANEEGKREADIKNIVRVNERRVKIGWELDLINAWWSTENVRNYFKKFIQAKSEEVGVGVKLFKEDKYPINLLLLLFAEKRNEDVLTLELIEKHNNDALGLYKELIKLHSTLQDWFGDRDIYHYLGYLFNNSTKKEINFNKIWHLWENSNTRNSFKNNLKVLIKKQVFDDGIILDFTEENTNWYSDQPKKLVRVLVLLDVIHSTMENQAYLPFDAFTKADNDIEHIFPQNPEKVEEKREYIEFLNTYVLNKEDKFDTVDYEILIEDEDYLQKVNEFIEKQVQSVKINSIGNLVLLYFSLNRSIGRISYAKKRARIIEYFNEGNFIQPHTFKVFVRYFIDKNNQSKDLERWTNKDIEANSRRITESIQHFFKNITE